jgi:hypothetical protein
MASNMERAAERAEAEHVVVVGSMQSGELTRWQVENTSNGH